MLPLNETPLTSSCSSNTLEKYLVSGEDAADN